MKGRKAAKRLRARQKDYDMGSKRPENGFKRPGSNQK